MNNSIQKPIAIFIALLTFSIGYAQLPVPFKVRYQSYVKGDMTVIANTITNRSDYNNSSNIPYHNHSNHARLNDEFVMEYIDIDTDNSTFSSSSAQLILPNSENKKIIYAGLYWSSTYKYKTGTSSKTGKYQAIDKDRETIDNIKIKLPNQDSYINIVGEVLFDGLGKKEFKDCAPYAVYADITDEIKKLKDPFGEYTVANIKATQGNLSGGVASGWSLFVVYEDQSMNGKFITSFDGFAGVTDQQVDINFSGFQTLPEGEIKAKIALASLEGDNNLLGDQILFKSANERKFIPIENKIRKANNFFNSSITSDDNYFVNRKPDGKNTLGYDTCLINISNPNNSVIGNNVNQAALRLTSSGDRCYLFFAAFNVEVTEKDRPTTQTTEPLFATTQTELPYDKKQTSIPIELADSAVIDSKVDQKQTSNQIKLLASINKREAKKQQQLSTKATTTNENDMSEFTDEVVQIEIYDQEILESSLSDCNVKEDLFNTINSTKIKRINVDGLSSGYYIIANVFEIDTNLKNFLSTLNEKGIQASSFYNPINTYNYVYLAKTDDKMKALELYNTNVNNTYNEHIWLLSVNNSQDSALTNLDD